MTGREFSEVEIDLLADYVGGALDGTPEHATVAQLVAEDPAWARAHAELSAATVTVHSQLADWGATTEPMPVDVADRVAAALSDAASSPPQTRPTLTAVPGGRPATRTTRRSRRWRSWAVPTAAAAGVLVAAGFGISLIDLDGAQDAGTTSAEAPASARDQAGAGSVPQVMQDTTQQLIASGLNYQRATLAGAAIPAEAADATRAFSAQETTDLAVPEVLRRLVAGDALGACLNTIAAAHDRGRVTVQAVDYATFEAEPAVMVFFADDSGERWIWVSGPACGLTGPDTRANARIP